MQKFLCPCCSYPLLCYASGGQLRWFCPRCRQEMPYGTAEETRSPDGTRAASDDAIATAVSATSDGEGAGRSPLEFERYSSQFQPILNETVRGLRQVLQVDRALICRTGTRAETVVVAESCRPGRSSMLKCRLGRFLSPAEQAQFRDGQIQAIADLSAMDLDRCPTKILECFFNVSAKLVVPVRLAAETDEEETVLWGLLLAHQCYTPRAWTREAVEMAVFLAQQLAQQLVRDRQYCQLERDYERIEREVRLQAAIPRVPETMPTLEPSPEPPPSVPVADATPEAVLKSYVAYYLSRGKAIVSPHHGLLGFDGTVYQYDGYHLDFETFWRQIERRRDFLQLYLIGDMRCFEQFLSGCYTVSECSRCHLPIPARYGVAYDVPECTLCEDECPTKQAQGACPLMRAIVVGESPSDVWQAKRQYERNAYLMEFVEEPAEILAQRRTTAVDAIVLRGGLTERTAANWAQQFREHRRFDRTPILAFSDRAGYGLPWVFRPMDLEDYFLPPLNGEHLVTHLRGREKRRSSLLHWFPR